MRVSTLLAASAVLAPATTLAIALPWDLTASPMEIAASALHSAQGWLYGVTVHGADAIKDKLAEYEQTISSGVRTATVDMHGIEYLAVSHPAFPQHKLRVVEPKICDPKVKQLSGYLDISDSKHLFFWFEASRSNPSKDPLVLWLNGGPGCSSSTGLLFELGGCTVIDGGNNVTYNKDAWNNNANVIFLDQPVGVGYSYSDNGNEVNNSPASAEDVYAFLMLFISQFSEYSKQDFHVAGESYAGTYIPNIASVIYKHNAALEVAPTPKMPKINLKSVLIGNGLTDPFHQFGSLPAAACDGPYAVFDPEGSECVAMRGKVPRCQNLISSCYKTGSRFACLPASLYCWSMFSPLQQLGVNLYDVRKTCDKSKDKDGPLCYKEMGWMETYLNRPEVKKELGAPAEATFQSCNMQINQNFLMQGDGTHNTVGLLPELVESGIRVLIYAGMADMMVNYIGCAEVLDNLETSYLGKYTAAPIQNFTAPSGEVVGWTKSAGKGAGNVAFVAFNNAGHMVPHDEPKASLKMLNDWLKNKPLA